ncbi:MAG: DUF1284 domain-containing protein [Sarcina sp.]
MILRPHHLLCTQAYIGKGYSKEFIENMDKWTKILREEKGYIIKLEKTLDNLCNYCPSSKGDRCESEDKVMAMDEKVLNYFNLKEDFYCYSEVVKKIKREINKEIFDDICKDCQWYEYDICEKLILK